MDVEKAKQRLSEAVVIVREITSDPSFQASVKGEVYQRPILRYDLNHAANEIAKAAERLAQRREEA